MASEMAPQTPQRFDPGVDSDNAFMAMCLQHINPETKKIDMGAVAEALGYTNSKSAGNRFSTIKKRYSIQVEVAYPRADGTNTPKASPKKVQKATPKRSRKRKAAATEDSLQLKKAEAKEPEPKEVNSKDDGANGDNGNHDEEGKPNPDEV